jgi:hypothetical protein
LRRQEYGAKSKDHTHLHQTRRGTR